VSDVGLGDHYRVETPERVEIDYAVAGIGSRFLAALVDAVLVFVLVTVLGVIGSIGIIAVAALASAFLGVRRGDNEFWGVVGIAAMILIWFAIIWGYFVFFELIWHGQTPGKRWLGLRVIKEGGYPVGFAEVAIRNVVRLVDFLPFYYVIGIVVMFIDGRSRRLGDLAAGTLVVKERRDLRLETLTAELERVATATVEPGAPIANLDRLTADDLALLHDYLGRRATLRRDAAAALAKRLAGSFGRRLDHDLGDESPESFLERLAAQAQPAQRS
jgi:uncharacterized RDD family membrane protein YckC